MVFHPADANVEENVPEPEASHHEGTYTKWLHVFSVDHRLEQMQKGSMVKGCVEEMRDFQNIVLLTMVSITCVLVCLYSLSNKNRCI